MKLQINPNYKPDKSTLDKDGYNNNCAKCAIAFEAYMRGGDVQANQFRFGHSDDIDKSRYINKAFGVPSSEIYMVGRPKRDQVVREIELTMLEDFGDGSRAILQIQSGANKHCMNVLNDNGVIKIVDAQSGEYGSVAKMLRGLSTKQVNLFRVDDMPIDPEWAKWAYTEI